MCVRAKYEGGKGCSSLPALIQGVKLFYLTGLVHGQYLKQELHNLSRFISVMKFRPLEWRSAHPYLLVDRFNPEPVLC